MRTKNLKVSVMWSCHCEKYLYYFSVIYKLYIANGEALYVFIMHKNNEKV